jgi:aminoglycoside phosphotransferase (APT) family kinase protein
MVITPRRIIDSVVRSVCRRDIEHLVALAGGGMNETYRVGLVGGSEVVVRIARQDVPWFVDEAHLMAQARAVDVPTAEVLGLEHLDHDGELLSFSVQEFLPGRSLEEVMGELPAGELERLVVDAGEILARVHSVVTERGMRHELRMPEEHEVTRVAQIVRELFGQTDAAVVERGAVFLRRELATRATPPVSLVHGDFCPKNLLIHDGAVVGFIDWEFAGAAPAAYDFAQWEVDAGAPMNDRLDLVRRGYARIADPASADAGWTPAFAIDWALEKLGWKNPASLAQMRRCLDVMARYAG